MTEYVSILERNPFEIYQSEIRRISDASGHQFSYYPHLKRTFEDGRGYLILAKENCNNIGFAILTQKSPEAFGPDFTTFLYAVVKEHQHKGVGIALFNQTVTKAKELGGESLQLDIRGEVGDHKREHFNQQLAALNLNYSECSNVEGQRYHSHYIIPLKA